MSFYTTFTSKSTNPDFFALVKAIREVDPTAGPQHDEGSEKYIIKTEEELDDKKYADMQLAIDNAASISEKGNLANQVDTIPTVDKTIYEVFLDEINELRIKLELPPKTLDDILGAAKEKR